MTTTILSSPSKAPPRSPAGRTLSRVTDALCALVVGEGYAVSMRGGDADKVRSRLSNNMRTAHRLTGHRFTSYTLGRTVWIVREE